MRQILGLTTNPLQSQTLVLDDGTAFTLTIYFRPMQQGWFINNLTYGSFVLKGVRITNSPNILYQWQNKLPFGLGCFSVDNREPSLQEDLSSGATSLNILDQADVLEFGAYIRAGV